MINLQPGSSESSLPSGPAPLLNSEEGIIPRIKYPAESVRNLCLLGGAASMLSSLLGVVDIFGLASPIHYICNFYLLIFGATSVILEYGAGSFDRLGVIPTVDTYFKALTFVWGRGMFYIFQGTLTLAHITILNMVVGFYLCMIGCLCLAHHWGVGGRPGYLLPVSANNLLADPSNRT
jgi:hypothetical protein